MFTYGPRCGISGNQFYLAQAKIKFLFLGHTHKPFTKTPDPRIIDDFFKKKDSIEERRFFDQQWRENVYLDHFWHLNVKGV